jgi:two-component system, OmpR family, alkaline phosphatase synthesis response regulator PhoP
MNASVGESGVNSMRGACSKKILLVDDSATTLTTLAQMIIRASPSVSLITAVNGEEAVRIALQEKPDLILMDVVMPRMNGLQACRAIRASAEANHIPIILITTLGEDDNVLRGYASGCTGYIIKPFNPPELIALVRAHLGIIAS